LSAAAQSLLARARGLASAHVLLLAIIAAGAVVRFATLDQGIWSDENLAVQVFTLRPSEMLPRIEVAETNPPLYFLFAAPWERVFGDGDFALRALPALFGIATIPVVYAAGSALASKRAGLIAAAITAASPLMIWYSQEVRPYALFGLLSALSFLCFVQVLKANGSRWLWGWAIASALAISTHYFAALLFVIEAAWLLWSRREERLDVALASAAVGVAGLALLPLAVAQQGLTNWIELVDFGERLAQIPEHFLVGMSSPWGWLAPLVAAVVAVAVVYGFARVDRPTLRAASIAGGVFGAGIVIVLVAAALGEDVINTRNLICLWAPFAVAIGALLAAPALGRVGPALTAALCALGLGLAVWTANTAETARPDWDELAAAIGPASDGRAVLTESGFTAPLGRYVAGGGRDAVPGEQVTTAEIDVLSLRPVDDHSVGPCWWLGHCGGREMLGEAALPFPIPPEFEPAGEDQTSLYEIEHYRAPRPVTLPPAGFGGVLIQEPS
jgi:mannosyltransferase